MTPPTTGKTLLASDPDRAQAQLEELARALAAKDATAGRKLLDRTGGRPASGSVPGTGQRGPRCPRDRLPAGLGLLGRHQHPRRRQAGRRRHSRAAARYGRLPVLDPAVRADARSRPHPGRHSQAMPGSRQLVTRAAAGHARRCSPR